MSITAILKKLAAGEALTVDEKDFLLANEDVLTDEQKEAVEGAEVEEGVEETPEEEEEVVEEEEEEVDEKAMQDLIAKAVNERVGEITDKLAEKFVDGVAKSRKKALDTGKPQGKKDADEVTRDFMKSLFTGDMSRFKDVSGLSNAAGGYLIPDELRSEVLRVAEKQYGLARKEMRYLPFTGEGNSRKIPALASSVSVTWTDEAGDKQSTAPTFSIVTQTLKKLAAIVPMTEEIIEDSTINLTALIAELFAEAVAKEEDEQFFNGDGTVWTGILNNGSVNVVNIAGTDPAAVTAEDMLALIDGQPTGALEGSKFYMHRSVFSKIRSLREDAVSSGDGAGAYLVSHPTSSAPASIWGYPIELSDAFPAVSVTGNSKPFIAFGNLKKAAIFGDKQQLRVKLLDQATVNDTTNAATLNLAQQDMIAVRIVERVGYVLALPTAVTVLKTVAA
jgi:HK97 family phage major capsid protein